MATNQVTVSAVPFNPTTQSFQSVSPAPVNKAPVQSNVPTAAQNLAAYNASLTNTGSTYKTPTSSNVSVSNIGTQPINIPTQPVNSAQNYNAQINQAQTALQQIETPYTDLNNSYSQTISNLLPNLMGQQQELINQQNAQNLPALKQNLTNLNNQVLQKQAELNQDDIRLAASLNEVQKQAIPMNFITGQQQSIQRDAQIARALKSSEIGIINAQALAAQGNIALAQETAQQAAEARFAPFREAISILQAQQQAIQPALSAEEKRVSAQQSFLYDVQKTLVTQKQANYNEASKLIIEASPVADPQTIAKATNALNNGANAVEVAGILGTYGAKDYIQNKEIYDSMRNQTYTDVGQLTIDNGFNLDTFKKGIAGVESAGSGGYSAIGPATKSGDKAYGKYQVMGANIPSWTKEALGYSVSADQFLKSPDIQEKVFEFQSMKNYAKYGNWDDVASVWFSGRPLTGNTSSDGYNTVPQYVQKVRAQMGVSTQPTSFSMVTNPTAELWGKEYQKNGDISKIPKQFQTQALAYANQNVQNNPAQQSLQSVYQLANALASAPGKEAAVGAGFKKSIVSLIPFVSSEALPGTQRADFEAKFNQLKDSLAAANLDKLKGAMSDKDIQFLRNIGTSLTLDMSEPAFNAELQKIAQMTQNRLLQSGGNILGNTPTNVFLDNALKVITQTSTPVSVYSSQFTR